MSELERLRLLHSDIELRQEVIVDDLIHPPTSSKERILQDHRVKLHMQHIQQDAETLLKLYKDEDGLLKSYLEEISGENVFSTFYDKLKRLREHYRKYPESEVRLPRPEVQPDVKFSGEEMFGKYVDMHILHDKYVNIPFFERLDYISYLKQFDKFHTVPREEKLRVNHRMTYRKYLEDVLSYLLGFFRRVYPLVDTEEMLELIELDFAKRWTMEAVTGWFGAEAQSHPSTATAKEKKKKKKKDKAGEHQNEAMKDDDGEDSAAAEGAEEEEDNVVKDEDDPDDGKADELFCKACNRSFANPSVFQGHLRGKKHKRNTERLREGRGIIQERRRISRELALLEDKIFRFAELLRPQLHATQDFLERKQTRTYEELMAELAEMDAGGGMMDGSIGGRLGDDALDDDDEDSDAAEEEIYNPKNVPKGWDGKPIPLWLYKLHGLNHEFKCQICGNYTYKGPRAFERHFSEWRHTYGLRVLGIPNSPAFRNIVTFDGALELWQKLQEQEKMTQFRPEAEEQFEDKDGNVYNRETYELLKKQGVI